jgi:shikimate dehydrogenase
MRRFGLIGFPLGHSFSREYFTEKFASEKLSDAVYENFPLKDIEFFPELVSSLQDLKGLNVTIPHKTNIIRFLSSTDQDAANVGAVNVIKITEERDKKTLKGYNTDIYGFRESVVPFLKPHHNKALILGTGGSSLAVKYVLTKLGISFLNISRTASDVSVSYNDLTDDLLRESTLVINTTPVGMYPDTENCPDINYSVLTRKHILYDLVYNPEKTKFLRKGEELGCTVIGGLNMLHLQAEKAWEIWNNET